MRRAIPLGTLSSLAVACLAGCAGKPEAPAPAAPPPAAAPAPTPEPVAITLVESDLAAIRQALTVVGTKPVDVVVPWSNGETGRGGGIKILRDGFDSQNRPCREFHQYVVQGPLFRHSTGFLCRQPDGAWEVVEVRDYPIYRMDNGPGGAPTPAAAARSGS